MSPPDDGAAPAWTIRPCREQEAEALVALWGVAAAPGITDTVEDVRRALAHPHCWVLVAEVEGRIVGSVIGTFDGWRGNYYRLAVDPAHRRRGCARALVAAAEALIVGAGAKRITALVERDRPWATAFWQAADYPLDPRVDRYVRTTDSAS